jgi:hypothetical protein
MNPRRKRVILTFLAILCCLLSRAQQYSVLESNIDIKGPKHDILHCTDGGFITITYPFTDDKDPVTVTRFDAKLNQQYSNEIKDLSHEHYRASIYGTGGLFLLTSNKDGGVSSYAVTENTGVLSGSPVSLFSMDAKEEDAEFTSGSSPDNNLHYIIAQGKHRKEKGEILQGALIDRRGNKIVAFSYTTPEDRDDFKHLDVVLSNDGIIDLVYNVAVRPGKDDYTPFKYTIVQVDLRGRPTAIPLSSLPEGDLRNIAWSLDKHSRILFTGFLSAKKKTGFTAIMSGSFDPITKKLGALSQTEITPLLTNQPDFVKDLTKKGLPTDISLIKTLNLPDGSRALVLEDNSDKVYQSYYPAFNNPVPYSPVMGSFGNVANASNHNIGMTPSYSIVYQKRGNNYIVKLDQNNIPLWINLVSKNQSEPDIALAVGTACVADDRGNIHLFFYDDKKNTDVSTAKPKEVDGYKNKKHLLACVTIAPDGSMKKQMHPQQDPHFRMMLEKSVTGSNNEAYFLAIKTKKAFTQTHLLNHAKFHLGELSVGGAPWQALTTTSPQSH